ncbi:MAG: uridine kinase, partial [Spirochaetes bacterium GWB1_48_6]
MSKIQIVGVCGGSGSGKTTIVNSLKKIAGNFPIIPQDNYYRSAEYVNNQRITGFNFDHPSAFDVDLLVEHLKSLKDGHSIQMPLYDFVHHRRTEETTELKPARLVVLEGIMILFEKSIRDLLDLTLYVDTPEDIRFIRRLQRDISERG